jgi:hypothetical protein
MHLLKTYKARYKSDVKIDGKKDKQYAFIRSVARLLKCAVKIDGNKG